MHWWCFCVSSTSIVARASFGHGRAGSPSSRRPRIRRRFGGDHVGLARDPEHIVLVADYGCSAHDLLEIRDVLQAVSHALDQLSARQRTVLVAIAINGVPTERLAREFQCTPGAIYKSLHDARAKLKLHLASLQSGDAQFARAWKIVLASW